MTNSLIDEIIQYIEFIKAQYNLSISIHYVQGCMV